MDKDNKVVAIGNPVLNPKVKELYLEKLTGTESARPHSVRTTITMDKPEIDFGTFPMTEKKEGMFWLTNTGTNLLVVHQVVTSCGCTKVEYDRRPVRPGDTLRLNIRYEPDDSGYFSKSLIIHSNAEGSPHKVRVKGQVE